MGLAASPQRPDLFLVAEVSDPCQAWGLRGQWVRGLWGQLFAVLASVWQPFLRCHLAPL